MNKHGVYLNDGFDGAASLHRAFGAQGKAQEAKEEAKRQAQPMIDSAKEQVSQAQKQVSLAGIVIPPAAPDLCGCCPVLVDIRMLCKN